MNRTKILTWQRDRIPTWMLTVVMATAIALSLMWGVNPAAADTAPASTPTVAPTTVATVAPTTVATVVPTTVATVVPVATLAPVATATPAASGSVRTRAQAPGDQCASPDPTYASPCALEMVLVPEATPAGDTGWRVGDLIKVEIRVKNHSATEQKFNGLSAHADFVLSELQLVDASKTPVAVSTSDDGAIISLTETDLPSTGRQILKNYYSQVGLTGKIDFEAGVTGAAYAVTVPADTGDVLIGSFHVRVRTNPSGNPNYTLTLRAQNAVTDVAATDGARNSVIGDGSSVGTAGLNIMGKATSAVLPVRETIVDLAIVPSKTTIGQSLASDRRVGDIIPVDLTLTATTIVRNATSLNAVITFPSADYVLVTGATDSTPVSPTNGVGAVINTSGFAFGAGALASATGAANTFSVVSTLPTITLNIDGTALTLDAAAVKTVGRFYVRPKYNGDTIGAPKNLTIAANPSLGIRALGGSLGFTTTVTGAGPFRVAVEKTTVTLSLKVADPVDLTRKHRTGDTIQVELQVAASDIARNATSLDATITVPSADYVLVDAPTPSKLLATAPVVKTTNGVAFGNTFTSKGGDNDVNNSLTSDTITLKIDGTALNLLDQTAVTIGTFYVRPKYNGDTSGAPKNLTIGASPMIGIRASDTNAGYTAGDLGFTFEAGVNGGNSAARVAVDETTVAMSLVPTLPSPLRIGGQIRVDVKITPTFASYVNHVQTAIAINGNQFQIVENALLADSETVTAAEFANPAKTNTFASNVLTYEVASGDLSTLTAGTNPITIGTFYVRPRMKEVTNLDFTSTTVANEKQPGASYLFGVTTTQTAASPTVTAALGTLGVSLAMRSPTVQYNTLSGDDISFIASNTSPPTLNVVDGRYLDVRIKVRAELDAGGKAKEVDRFLIDLTIDPLQLEIANTSGTVDAGATSIANGITGPVMVVDAGATVSLDLTKTAGNISTDTEVARLRFKVKRHDGDSAGASAAIALKVADTTILKQSTGLFVTDNYADPVSLATIGEFDLSSTATRQKPATLQVSTMLQGRIATSPDSRFVQNFGIELRKAVSDGGTAVARHLTVTDAPASVRTCSGSPASPCPDMKFDKFSKKASSGPNAEFASSDQGGAVAEPLADLEPGTYDVYLKGRSSVAVLVTGVTFGAGDAKSITGLVLREGDIAADVDKVNLDDFTAWKANYNAVPTTDETKRSDFNQSGYVDILDFSLLASNFNGARDPGPYAVAHEDQQAGLNVGTVMVSRLRPTTTSPHGSLTASVGTANDDGIVPVTLSLTPGSRPVEGAQVVLKTAPGVQIVDSLGNAVDNDTAFVADDNTSLPTTLRQTIDAARGLLNLGLGSISRSVASDTTLGTLFLKITGTPAGAPISFLRTDGSFATLIAGSGDDLTGKLIVNANGQVIVDEVDAIIPAPAPSTPVTVSEPAAAAPARASAPSRAAAPAPAASAPVAAPMSPALSEDTARGIVSVAIPGREPVELKTGLATLVPDAYCPTVRHNTYIRLEDEGIAGATFGVEAGGVLSWVTPDQAGCVNWSAISEGGLTFTKETIMQFQLARAVPGALLWVLSGDRNGELYEVDPNGIATYITGENFAANQDHFRQVWANVIPVSTSQVDGLASRGAVSR